LFLIWNARHLGWLFELLVFFRHGCVVGAIFFLFRFWTKERFIFQLGYLQKNRNDGWFIGYYLL
jgi:hypothetical protein